MPDAKYMTVKIGDWLDAREALNRISNDPHVSQAMRDEIDGVLHDLDAARIEDAMVIRQQDVFAPGVLHTYASAVQSAIEVIGHMTDDRATDLEELRDRFFEAAEASVAMHRKIPD